MAEILDLDIFVPPAREVAFTDRAGKRHSINVSFMSFKTAMFMLANLDKFRGLAKSDPNKVDEGTFRTILGVIEELASEEDSEVTVDFLFKNLSIVQAMKMIEVAMEPITRFLKENPPEAAAPEESP